MTIHQSVCQQLLNTLQDHLIETLELSAPDASQKLEDLLAEDPELLKRRSDLTSEREKLVDVREKLRNL